MARPNHVFTRQWQCLNSQPNNTHRWIFIVLAHCNKICWSTCSSTTIPLSLNVGDNFFSFFIFLFSFIHFFLIFGDIKCCIIHNSIFFHSFFLKLEGNIFFILFYPPFVLNFGGRRKYCIQIHVSISFIHSF